MSYFNKTISKILNEIDLSELDAISITNFISLKSLLRSNSTEDNILNLVNRLKEQNIDFKEFFHNLQKTFVNQMHLDILPESGMSTIEDVVNKYVNNKNSNLQEFMQFSGSFLKKVYAFYADRSFAELKLLLNQHKNILNLNEDQYLNLFNRIKDSKTSVKDFISTLNNIMPAFHYKDTDLRFDFIDVLQKYIKSPTGNIVEFENDARRIFKNLNIYENVLKDAEHIAKYMKTDFEFLNSVSETQIKQSLIDYFYSKKTDDTRILGEWYEKIKTLHKINLQGFNVSKKDFNFEKTITDMFGKINNGVSFDKIIQDIDFATDSAKSHIDTIISNASKIVSDIKSTGKNILTRPVDLPDVVSDTFDKVKQSGNEILDRVKSNINQFGDETIDKLTRNVTDTVSAPEVEKTVEVVQKAVQHSGGKFKVLGVLVSGAAVLLGTGAAYIGYKSYEGKSVKLLDAIERNNNYEVKKLASSELISDSENQRGMSFVKDISKSIDSRLSGRALTSLENVKEFAENNYYIYLPVIALGLLGIIIKYKLSRKR